MKCEIWKTLEKDNQTRQDKNCKKMKGILKIFGNQFIFEKRFEVMYQYWTLLNGSEQTSLLWANGIMYGVWMYHVWSFVIWMHHVWSIVTWAECFTTTVKVVMAWMRTWLRQFHPWSQDLQICDKYRTRFKSLLSTIACSWPLAGVAQFSGITDILCSC